jgi:RND superfamily putative drug exporter
MFEKIARFSVKFRWPIIIFWIAMVPILTANLPNINDVTKNSNSDFLPKSSPSTTAVKLENNFLKKDTADITIIVSYRSTGLTPADKTAVNKIASNLRHSKYVSEVRDLGQSADGTANQLQVGINGAGVGPSSVTVLKDFRAEVKNLPPGLQVHFAGQFAEAIDSQTANQRGRNSTEFYTVIFILVLLLVVFRSLLAPIVTLLPAGLALAIAQPVIAEATKAGVEVSFITQILLIVLMLGAGTDYGLFLVFRVREQLRRGAEPKEAVVQALSHVGESITFSALTVASALLALLLASFGIYRGLGPALAIALGIMLLISLTFLPALLSILGRAVFWPSKTHKQPLKIGLWGRIADKVIERPALTLVIGLAILGALMIGLTGYRTSGFTNNSAPKGTDSAAGSVIVKQHYPATNINPQLVLLHFEKPVWNNLALVQQAQNELADSGRFKAVGGPFTANGFNLTPETLQQLHSTDPKSPVLQAVSQFISSDGKTIQLYATTKQAPGSNAATNATPENRAALQNIAKNVGATKTAIFSNEAVGYDIFHTATNDLEKIIPVVLLIIAVLLAIVLRSLVAPWYLIVSVLLSYLATLGFAMIVFVHLGGQDGLNFILPFLLFIFSLALGEDYNILLMTRIREESRQSKTLKAAVTRSVGITGTTITSAGLILAGSFAVLGLVGGDQQIEQIGYSIAFGILLDTFFVRTLLVPSMVALLGRWNWWPSELYRTSK